MSDEYDAGLLGDRGGGDVDWWHDYLRQEIGRANDFHRDIHERLRAEIARLREALERIAEINAKALTLRAAADGLTEAGRVASAALDAAPAQTDGKGRGMSDECWQDYLRAVEASDYGDALLRKFARRVAFDVLHLWDAPEIVREYLESGDESKRDAAGAAARNVDRASTRAAAQAAAQAAAWYAAGGHDNAWDAARAAADYAADTAGHAAYNAARASTGNGDAAVSAAWDSAWDAARAAARDKQYALLTEVVKAAQPLPAQTEGS